MTILDSLHEEVNIRLEKPFMENPQSFNRDEEDLMTEYWANFLRRNWSFLGFIVYGQMRSYLKCLKCSLSR